MTSMAVVDSRRLSRALAVRGLTAEEVRRQAGGLSRATMASLSAGRPVHPRTLRRLAAALAANPVDPVLDELLVGDVEKAG